jgi:tetratricopeptide (TPR) repeat protein
MNEGALDDAEEQFEEALLREPMNSDYRFELANLYAMRHDEFLQAGDEAGAKEKMEASARELEQAVMARPDFLAAQFNLGVVYKRLGKYENARKQFKKALELNPAQGGPAMLQIGATYEEQGFYDEAETIYKELLEKYPNHPELHRSLQELAERREDALMDEMRARDRRISTLSSGLSALSQGVAQRESSAT